jgi:hypothetical protein
VEGVDNGAFDRCQGQGGLIQTSVKGQISLGQSLSSRSGWDLSVYSEDLAVEDLADLVREKV